MPTQRSHNLLGRQLLDQAGNDQTTIDSEYIGQNSTDTSTTTVQYLLCTVAHSCTVVHQLAPVTTEGTQIAKFLRRNKTMVSQIELTNTRQPTTVFNIRLATSKLFDLLRMHQVHLDSGFFDGIERCLPVHSGRFHGNRFNVLLLQPRYQFCQSTWKCRERTGFTQRLPALCHTTPHCGVICIL